MSRVCKIVLVCEGWRDSAFARGFLGAAGVDARNLYPKTNPGGSGHDWVKTQFVEEVAYLQKFSEGRGVLGLLDEDGHGAIARSGAVSTLLQAHGLPSINSNHGLCLLLPTRNLETWLYWLKAQRNGTSVILEEVTDYKITSPVGISKISNDDCRPAGEFLHSLNHHALPQSCPPTLGNSLPHLRAFLKAIRR